MFSLSCVKFVHFYPSYVRMCLDVQIRSVFTQPATVHIHNYNCTQVHINLIRNAPYLLQVVSKQCYWVFQS